MNDATILVVDDEDLIRFTLRQRLEAAGHSVLEAGTGAQARAHLEGDVDLVLLDYKLPDTDGVSLLQSIKQSDPDRVVILMSAFSTIETAVQAMKLGAFHYAVKPFDLDEFMLQVDKALETARLKREVRALRASASEPYAFQHIVGASPAMQDVVAMLRRVAVSPASTVLLTGESGTGKDLAAKVIHYNSARAAGRFVNITCSALPDTLLESELFGHERGAFTDARAQKRGLLELADKGTVFLDEIGEMSPAAQAKFLRVLEEKTFRRVGGASDVRVDVRVIAATNRDLEQDIKDGRFRADLYYRLSVLPVRLPPLRERQGDIPLLIEHWVRAFNREFRKNVRGVAPEAVEALGSYAWPGNVRELRNAVERAMLLADGEWLTAADFPVIGSAGGFPASMRLPGDGIDIEQLERSLVEQALARTHGNQTRAAALLGMNRDQIRYRIEKFGLARSEIAPPQADS
ncbi:MAG TPA: sigma-54 dependent transcriptional regulator [Planctomycetota bacterium]|nr:sigma-54 dependent transcriptional regulator [Planctomycetota bacterium]